MSKVTLEELQELVRNGENLSRIDLRERILGEAKLDQANFQRADLEGANLERADLRKATLKASNLREAFLAEANLEGANLENADLEGANLAGANLRGANLSRANLEGANLTNAILENAQLSNAILHSAVLEGTRISGATMINANLEEAFIGHLEASDANFSRANLCNTRIEGNNFRQCDFQEATFRNAMINKNSLIGNRFYRCDLQASHIINSNLEGCDLRFLNISKAIFEGVNTTGTSTFGISGEPSKVEGLTCEWCDQSEYGDQSRILKGNDAINSFGGQQPQHQQRKQDDQVRYFGHGDILKNATLHFDSLAKVEIDSMFENCKIHLADGARLTVGNRGFLNNCQIFGGGNVAVNGVLFEKDGPAVNEVRELKVGSQGTLVSTVKQHPDQTRFLFEKGSRLQLRVLEQEATKDK